MYIFKQIAVVYNQTNPTEREFIVNKDLKIVSFTTKNKNKENYFFYD